VLYVNGIAVGVLELKRSIVAVAEGIRQNLDNQKREFIRPFFATVQLVMAGNDTEGLRYGVIQTPEAYYLTWKEPSEIENPLDRAVSQLCRKERLLEVIHDFIVFDAGTKKACRHNQYFGVRAAQGTVKRREGGVIWHTQGSGKSLTMVWLAKWIREHVKDARVLLITDRTELDDQIEKVFKGVNEGIYRTKSGADLVNVLNKSDEWLICSLVRRHEREHTLNDWYRTLLRGQLSELLPKWEALTGVRVAECRIRRMKTRWGTCNAAAGRIWVNLELARKPPTCLEYILVHEMVHLFERHHNDRFKQQMDRLVPQWRLYRDILNRSPLSHEDWNY
jgi:predicted metal-dependent hydrolase